MKLYIEQGLPASGKTTHARKLVDNGNVARINYDDMRESIFNGKWSATKERAVQDAAKAMVRSLLGQGLNVVIDNTNLTDRHIDRWKTIANEFVGCTAEVIRHDVPLWQLFQRDQLRGDNDERFVGRAVIERMSLQAGWTKFAPEDKIVIVDVDGTLANTTPAALKYLAPTQPKNDWEGFFLAGATAEPIYAVQKWTQNLRPEYKIVICSGRSDKYSDLTVSWLEENDIPFDHIYMRRSSDFREDVVIKKEILDMLPKNQIAFIIDDRNCVIDMWRRVKQEEGLSYSVYQAFENNY